MNITEAEDITADFGNLYANDRGALVVLEDGTTADTYMDQVGLLPYLSVWDLPHSPAIIKYAILYRAEHAVKNSYMDFIPPGDERENTTKIRPIGNWLEQGYGYLSEWIENAHEINKARQDILSIDDEQKQKVAIIKFEAKHKLNFNGPFDPKLRVEFQNFLAELHGNW